MKKKLRLLIPLLVVLAVAAFLLQKQRGGNRNSLAVEDVPDFSGDAYVVINDNQPSFQEKELDTDAYEYYSPLDLLGRCGYAMACVGRETMPAEERGNIGQVKPSGWQTVKYDIVDGKYLYNRCHLIGFQLTGENANVQNLITGTRFLNVEGMLPFENMVADYIKETGNHVLYRVTPIYDGEELVARGVQMEAISLEDDGEGICFNIYAYNNQPGIIIDYATGESSLDAENTESGDTDTYILNTGTKKFHRVQCEQAQTIKESNRQTYTGSRALLEAQGYAPCGGCKP